MARGLPELSVLDDSFRCGHHKVKAKKYISDKNDEQFIGFEHGLGEGTGMTDGFLRRVVAGGGGNIATYDHPHRAYRNLADIQSWRTELLETYLGHLRQNGSIDTLMGHSQGALGSAQVAARDERIKRVLWIAPAITLYRVEHIELLRRARQETVNILSKPRDHGSTSLIVGMAIVSVLRRLPEIAAEAYSIPSVEIKDDVSMAAKRGAQFWVIGCRDDMLIPSQDLKDTVVGIKNELSQRKIGQKAIKFTELPVNHMGILSQDIVSDTVVNLLLGNEPVDELAA